MVSLFDMLALWLMVGVPVAIGYLVAKSSGMWVGIGAGLLSAVPCVIAAVLLYRNRWRRNAQRRQKQNPQR